MRVLWMLSGLAMGGSERNIVSVLPHLRDCGATVMLCTLNKRRDGPLAEVFARTGIERFDLGAGRMIDAAAWRRFTKLLSELKVDILHAEDQDSIIYAALAHRLLGVPTVMTRHVLDEPSTTWKEAVRAQLVLWSAHFGMDRIVAVSESVRTRFSRQAHVPLSRIRTIYNGIDLERFELRHRREDIRKSLGWKLDRPTAILISVMRPGKGFEILFEAMPAIRAALPGIQVKLVGEGPLETDLRRQAASLGDAIEFLGQRMDVPELLAASDLLIQASWSEALPTVLIEAAASGLPVVATDVGGTTEIIEDGKAGFILPPGNAELLAARIVQILQHPDLARQMGRHAHSFVRERFSLPRQAAQTLAVYEGLLHTHHENPL